MQVKTALPAADQSDEYGSLAAAPQEDISDARANLQHRCHRETSSRPFHLVFDVSDAVNYFRSARLPTGIQRVQVEVVQHAIREASFAFSIACFTKESNYWVEIPRELFANLSALSVGDFSDHDWKRLAESLEAIVATGRSFKFVFGSILLNLGSSWWLQNYFVGVRYAKAKFGILYVPFIHDLIPMAMPELCVAELRNNFEEWIESVFIHADFFLVNSQNTCSDLRIAAQKAGVEREIEIIKLDADFRTAPTVIDAEVSDDNNSALKSLGLEREHFVLFVSTIEPRKNHALAFAAWLKLLRRHGPENCPKLVCVGQRGWLNSEAHARLGASEELNRQVVILSNISDVVLSKLYEACICTLYPSLYEGWGLPVTESLCFGKVPIISRVASLPEAGGDFAEYFEVDSERSFLESVERILFDPNGRRERENKINTEFRPRRWHEVGAEIIGHLRNWNDKMPVPAARQPSRESVFPALVETGVFYSLAGEIQNARGQIARRGEMFRNGKGWWWPEPWGCWTRDRGPATLAFVVEGANNMRLSLYLGVRGVQGRSGIGTIQISGGQRIAVPLDGDEERAVAITLGPTSDQERQVVLTFTSNVTTDFRPPTKGRDFRVCGMGVKWFYVCREDDVEARLAFINTLATEEADWIGHKKEASSSHGRKPFMRDHRMR